MATGTLSEKLISLAMRTSIYTFLPNTTKTQTSIDQAKIFDNAWMGWPHYSVVPGAMRPDGPGQGAQAGGALIRKQRFSITMYTRSKLDPHSMSESELLDNAFGTSPTFQSLVDIFGYTFFGQPDGSGCLLIEPLWFAQDQGQNMWEDKDNGIVSRQFNWDAVYAEPQPSKITIFLPQLNLAELNEL